LGSALIQLSRLKSGLSQAKLAAQAGVPATMISAYERGRRHPTLETLMKLLAAAGFELRLHLAPLDDHDATLAENQAGWSEADRDRHERRMEAWRRAVMVR
jgi:transcriptional regulator with XRE-family HTH domain